MMMGHVYYLPAMNKPLHELKVIEKDEPKKTLKHVSNRWLKKRS